MRQSLKWIAAAAGAFVLVVIAGAWLWSRGLPVRVRHPHSNDPQQLLDEADYLFRLRNPIEAQPLYERAEQLFTARGDRRNAFYAKVSQLPVQEERQNLSELSAYLGGELQRPGIDRDPYLRLRLLVVKGQVDLDLDGLASQPLWQQVESLATSLNERAIASEASGELGILAFLRGNGQEAKERVRNALLYAKLFRDRGAEIRFLSMISQGFAEAGRADSALEYANQALELAAKNPDTGFPKQAVIGKASALTLLGEHQEARELLGKALAFARANQLTGFEVDVLAQWALSCVKTGEVKQAIELYEEAAAKAQSLQFLRATAEVAAELASLYETTGDLRKAAAWAADSANAHRGMGEIYSMPHHLAIQAHLLARMGQLQEAEHLYQKASDVIQAMLIHGPTFTIQRAVLGSISDVSVGWFELAAKQLKDPAKAFEIVERTRGRLAVETLRAHNILPRSRVEPPDSVESRLAALNQRIVDSNSVSERRELLKAAFETEEELNSDENLPVEEHVISLAEFKKDLDPAELVLEYVLDEPQSYCLAISREKTYVYDLAGKKEIELLVRDYLDRIKKRQEARAVAERLAAILLTPIPEYRQKANILVVPDGILHEISFDGLWSQEEGYALNRHSFTVSPSGNVVHLLRNEARPTNKIAFLGVAAKDSEPSTKTWSISALPAAVPGLLGLNRSNLKGLASTESEVRSIAKLLRGQSIVVAGKEATESRFKSEPLSEVEILHLALHGVADSAFPDRAALIFAGAGDKQDDGLLQAREIRKLPLHAELVTLSACDAGVGRIEGEEGVSSLIEAFLNAGARSVVASLWAAEDTYTKSLMQSFYRHLNEGQSKKEALRVAKIDMLREFGDQTAPLYWAGFILVGDGKGTITPGGGS